MQFLKENDLVPERLAFTGRTTQYPMQLCVIISKTRRAVTCLSLHDLKISDWFKHNTDIRCKRWHRQRFVRMRISVLYLHDKAIG